MRKSGCRYFRSRVNFVQYGPDSLPPGIFNQPDAFYDFRITGAGVHTLTGITQRLVISNDSPDFVDGVSDEALFQLVPLLPAYWMSRIEIQPDGATTEDTIYSQQLAEDLWLTIPQNMKSNAGNLIGMNQGSSQPKVTGVRSNQDRLDEDGNGIGPNTSREYFLPMRSMLTQAQIFLPAASQNPRIRSYMAQQPVCSDSSEDAKMVLQGADCYVSGILYEGDILLAMQAHYQQIPTTSRVLVHERQTLDVKTLTAFEPAAEQSLTVFNGSYWGFNMSILRTGLQNEELYDSGRTKLDGTAVDADAPPNASRRAWIPISRLTLTDSNGNPTFFNNISADFLAKLVCAEQFPETIVYGEKNLYTVPFGHDGCATFETGENTGGMKLDSNFQLQIVPAEFTSGGAGESYRLILNAYRYALLTMAPNGTFSVNKL